MCSEVILQAAVLAELPIVGVLNSGGRVELLDPHPHAHILHLEKLCFVEIM